MSNYDSYELSQLGKLIDSIRDLSKEASWVKKYLKLQALYVYFGYAIAEVHVQEEQIDLMEGGQHKNFENHEAYSDSLNKLYSSALSSYGYMRVVLHFTLDLIEISQKELYSSYLEEFRTNWKDWVLALIDKRDRIQAHPNYEKKRNDNKK